MMTYLYRSNHIVRRLPHHAAAATDGLDQQHRTWRPLPRYVSTAPCRDARYPRPSRPDEREMDSLATSSSSAGSLESASNAFTVSKCLKM